MSEVHLTIRAAAPEDDPALRRLAALDSARPLPGDVLLAERDGVPAAAVSLATGAVIADPFQPTADAVSLLRLRRYQLMRKNGTTPRWRLLLAPGRRVDPARS